MKSYLITFIILFAAVGLHCATATPPAAHKEIEELLHYVADLNGAVFIRNGGEHTAAEAAAHMRMKWEKQTDKVKTAEDFIALCGTQSLLSGERYRIRFKDSSTHDSAEVLREKLAELRSGAKKS